MRRYSTPIIVLDLLKQNERTPRESALSAELRYSIQLLNESIEVEENKIKFCALDFSSLSKNKSKTNSSSMASTYNVVGEGDEHRISNYSMNTSTSRKDSNKKYGDNHMNNINTQMTPSHGLLLSPHLLSTFNTTSPPSGCSSSTVTEDNYESTRQYDRSYLSTKQMYKLKAVTNSSTSGIASTTHAGPPQAEKEKDRGPMTGSKADALHELEDLCAWALSETAFFCRCGISSYDCHAVCFYAF